MPFQVIEILGLESDKILAKVSHQDHLVTVLIANRKSEEIATGQALQAEIGYDQILDWKVITDFDNAKSGIWQEEDGIHLRGKVHSMVDFGDGVTMIDVYMQNGPE